MCPNGLTDPDIGVQCFVGDKNFSLSDKPENLLSGSVNQRIFNIVSVPQRIDGKPSCKYTQNDAYSACDQQLITNIASEDLTFCVRT